MLWPMSSLAASEREPSGHANSRCVHTPTILSRLEGMHDAWRNHAERRAEN